MSAYIVDREHIRFLVNAALSRRILPHHSHMRWIWNVDREAGTYEHDQLMHGDMDKASEVGQMLWDENVASVRHRYPDGDLLPGPNDGDYTYGPHRLDFHRSFEPVAVLKACDGYEYQACEHPEWEDSQAYAFIRSLRRMAWQRVPGYEDASWEITA